MDKLLINQEHLKQYRPGSEFNDKAIAVFIREAQQLDFRPLLGDSLYIDFLTKVDDENDASYVKYQELLNGVVYTKNTLSVIFSGCIPVLSYYTLARWLSNGGVSYTNAGPTTKIGQQSQIADSASIKREVDNLKSSAIRYAGELKRFLIDSGTTYVDSEPYAERKTALNFFKL